MPEREIKFSQKEFTGAEQIQDLTKRGFKITRIFQPEQNAELEAYLDELKAQGKKPHEDFAFVIDKDSEGTIDPTTGKEKSRVIKVLEK